MDAAIIEKIIIDATQLGKLNLCKEIKLYFKYNIRGKVWKMFHILVLCNADFEQLIQSPSYRRRKLIDFNEMTKLASFI